MHVSQLAMFRFVNSRTLALLAATHVVLLAVVKCQDADLHERGSCEHNGQRYSHDDIWKPEPCRMCECNLGTAICEDIDCEELRYCSRPVIPFGECCPTCRIW